MSLGVPVTVSHEGATRFPFYQTSWLEYQQAPHKTIAYNLPPKGRFQCFSTVWTDQPYKASILFTSELEEGKKINLHVAIQLL